MRVSKAAHVFSNDVSSSLQLLAHCNNKPEHFTTAWFVKIVRKWFSLMTSRTCNLALGIKDENIYNDNMKFLNEVIDIFTQLQIGIGEFKPVQRGIIISTTSIINLTEYLIKERNFKFILTSRFTQDCVENLFSQIRRKNVIPDPLQFTNKLKLISIAMYMKHVRNSNYESDNREYLSGFLEYLSTKKLKRRESIMQDNTSNRNEILDYNNYNYIRMTTLDLNALYNIAGYILRSIMKTCTICNNCLKSVATKSVLKYSFSKFVQFKSYTTNSLYYINIKTFQIFLKLEQIFQYYSKDFNNMKNTNLKLFLIKKCKNIKAEHILSCHNLLLKIIKRFIVFRL